MNPVKRIGLVALLVVGVTLLASTTAEAKPGNYGDWGPIELTNVGDESQASGKATLTEVVLVGTFSDSPWSWTNCYTGRLTVQCKKLTPGATYWTPAGTFTANSRGEVRVSGDVYFEIWHLLGWYGEENTRYVVDVVRLNLDGSGTTVLTGKLAPPFGW